MPGVGFGLVVTVYYNGQVLAAGQSSGITAINYALPTLSTVSVTAPNAAALRTVGGDNVTITGSLFPRMLAIIV